MNYPVTRRSFLAASLAVIPGAWSLGWLSRLSLKEAEFEIRLEDWPPILVTTFSDGAIKAAWGGRQLDVMASPENMLATAFKESGRQITPPPTWHIAKGRFDDAECQLQIRRSSPAILDVAWIMVRHAQHSFGDNYITSMWQKPKLVGGL